jgi:hypothetical protein
VTERARHAAEGGKPREAGSAQASLACRARNVKNFHCLDYHGIVQNPAVKNQHRLNLHAHSEKLSAAYLHRLTAKQIIRFLLAKRLRMCYNYTVRSLGRHRVNILADAQNFAVTLCVVDGTPSAQ